MKGKKLNELNIITKHTGKDDKTLKEARRYLLQKLIFKNNKNGVEC